MKVFVQEFFGWGGGEVKGIVWWYRVQMERRRMKQGLEGVRQGWD